MSDQGFHTVEFAPPASTPMRPGLHVMPAATARKLPNSPLSPLHNLIFNAYFEDVPLSTSLSGNPAFLAGYYRWWHNSYLVEWFVAAVLLAVSAYVHFLPPFERALNLRDLVVWHAHLRAEVETFPSWFNSALCVFLPVAVFVAYHSVLAVKYRDSIRMETNPVTRQRWSELRRHDFHHACLALFTATALAHFVTEVLKVSIGRMRPDFLERCDWNDQLMACTGNPSDISEGRRSFPSGHSSSAFTACTIIVLYLAGKWVSFAVDSAPYRYRFAKCVVNLAPWALATWIAISRTQENFHHWEDVVVGALLGLACATLCYRIYFPSVFGGDSAAMQRPKHGYIHGTSPEEQALLNEAENI